jgi:hypothetical protein
MIIKKYIALSGLALALSLAPLSNGYAGPEEDAEAWEEAHETASGTNSRSARSQDRIDELHGEAAKSLQKFQTKTLQTEKLRVYTRQLQKLIANQDGRLASLESQLLKLDDTERDITPLMVEMVDTLNEFVGLDLPFKADERVERLETLSETMDDPELSVAIKYRAILDAYKAENDYGRAIGSYREELMSGAVPRMVDFVHLGRVALYYQSLDGGETGHWNQDKNNWEELSDRYAAPVRQAIRIAREQSAPQLLSLPVPAPVKVQAAKEDE